ncbi:MYXO-CTERM domain-containing protein [Paenibacillus taihuensis]|uniref:MYXO-CTERM domain-containing protein n=1 Tax=Paenibacillus taihuensis TaxID=1156355 RepID=A0A3D9QTZ8_9BACL|nr:WGxxGxxG family protein [Paenibacillus taihuensis]REE66706.1 MYXO-CTERM domain-containing protein [Paenibacillus taihuensis]
MKKTIASAVVGLSLSTLLVVPAMADTAMNGTGSGVNGQPTVTTNNAFGGTTTFNRPNAFGTPGSTGTPDVYGIPGTTKTYSDMNGRTNTFGTNAYYRYGNTNMNNMNSYSYGTPARGNFNAYAYNPTVNKFNNTTSAMRANTVRATAVDNDNHSNWGWLGLLGLIGLAGMRSRSRDHDRDRERI